MPITRKKFSVCPIERTIAVLSGRWKAMLVWRLLDGPMRYGELEKSLEGIAQRVLTQALRELEEDGVIVKDTDIWQLTTLGQALMEPMKGMWAWGNQHVQALPDR